MKFWRDKHKNQNTKIMTKTKLKNQKTLDALSNKANRNGRMPSLKKISQLLDELNIVNKLDEWSEEKWTKPSGFTYYTSGGTRTYNGWRLRVPAINMTATSTDTYYSWNTWSYANDLLKLITNHLNK